MLIRYCAYTSYSGYGFAAKNYIAAILRAGHQVQLEPLDNFPEKNQNSYPYNQVTIGGKFDPNTFSIIHTIPEMHRRLHKTTKTIAVAVYETWMPPAHWVAILNQSDAIIVPSQFNWDIFKEAGIKKPIFYIPHCLDMAQYTPDVAPLHQYDKFTFLFLGSWRNRKGCKTLIEAWMNEFSPNEPVQLVIKTDKPSDAETFIRHVTKSSLVFVAKDRYTDEQIPGFIKSADCVVLPTIGEAFGYTGLQAMALDVPVIITNYSGCQEYANANTATLLESEGIVDHKGMDGIPQFSNKKWVNISSHQIAERLRYVFSHQKEIKEKSYQGFLYVRDKFGYNKASVAFQTLFDNLL